MTDETSAEQLTDEEKAQLAVLERQARVFAKAQREQNDAARDDRDWERLGSMSAIEGRAFVRRQHGFDPGW